MSRLDLLLQTTPRPVDAQSRNPSPNSDAQGNSGGSAASDFGSLLDGLSGRQPREDAGASQRGMGLLATEGAKADPVSGEADADALQNLLSEVPPREGSENVTDLEAGSAAFSFFENLLPRILARAANGGHPDPERSGASFASASLATMQPDVGDPVLASSGLGSKLAVSVQSQETHFKPIIESLGGVPTQLPADLPTEEIGPTPEPMLHEKLKAGEHKSMQPASVGGTAQALADIAVETDAARASKELESSERTFLDRIPDRAEIQKHSPINGAKAEPASLPLPTLQHLAKSIIDDAKGISEPQHPAFQHDSLNRVATARASAGVLRVLDIQLKPAELGLVTIRMRLAGDSIEMEIQAQNEDTADLLRNDADKLSSLLRVSGYRPDVINIQSAETASHDRSSFHRPQQGSMAQGQSFDQGAAAGQGHSSRHQSDRYGSGGSEHHADGSEEGASGGSRTGGIYL